jgi:uncharacterized FlaG/YvyC family protein
MAIDSLTTNTATVLNAVNMRSKSSAAMAEETLAVASVSTQSTGLMRVEDELPKIASSSLLKQPEAVKPLDDQSVQRLNEALQKSGSNILFKADEDSGRMLFVMEDAQTGETIRQIPNEVVLKISQAIDDYLNSTQLESKNSPNNGLTNRLSGLLTNFMV